MCENNHRSIEGKIAVIRSNTTDERNVFICGNTSSTSNIKKKYNHVFNCIL